MEDRYCIMRELIGRRERKQSRAVEIIGGCLKMAVVKNSTRNELPKRKKKDKSAYMYVYQVAYIESRERESLIDFNPIIVWNRFNNVPTHIMNTPSE